ncbi:MAG: hypothetical protein RQ753_10230 [Desulfurivibrionaceae bacterium]|nr:hypothetical protein [Desulfurivibrionaceae bacterium]
MTGRSRYDYIDQDLPGGEILAILGELPKRWGRMDRISRLAVVEAGRVLLVAGLRGGESPEVARCKKGGLIGLTRRGSLATDLVYAATLKEGVEMASPTLFSYTLANIALAEAAGHYGLTGPVYAVFAEEPGAGGEDEARRWLDHDPSLDFMVAGELDVYPVSPEDHGGAADEVVSVNFKIVS